VYKVVLVMIFLLVSTVACGQRHDRVTEIQRAVVGGDTVRGQQAILNYGCGTCHVIPGIAGATAHVGPPLNEYARRHYVAGMILNNQDNLIAWLVNPQAINPGTAMPNLNVTEDDARDIATYLYSLR
jgi:cytochrome c